VQAYSASEKRAGRRRGRRLRVASAALAAASARSTAPGAAVGLSSSGRLDLTDLAECDPPRGYGRD